MRLGCLGPLTLFQIVEVGTINWVAKDEDDLDLGHGACDAPAGAVHVEITGCTFTDEDLLVVQVGGILEVTESIVLDVWQGGT